MKRKQNGRRHDEVADGLRYLSTSNVSEVLYFLRAENTILTSIKNKIMFVWVHICIYMYMYVRIRICMCIFYDAQLARDVRKTGKLGVLGTDISRHLNAILRIFR